MYYSRLDENAGPKKSPKIRHLGTISQLSGYIFTTKAGIDNQKNLLTAISPPHVLTIW